MVTFMHLSTITLPPFQYSSGGLISRPLRDLFRTRLDTLEEGGGQEADVEEK